MLYTYIMKKYIELFKNIIFKKLNTNYFSRINKVYLTKEGHVKKVAGKPFSRGKHNYDPLKLLKREIIFLKIMNGNNTPNVIDDGENWVTLSYCGEELSTRNLPKDWMKQIIKISKHLDNTNIIHRDIKKGNVLVSNNKLYLIDFGWAVFKNENKYISPRELDKKIPKSHIYDNKKALEWFISSYEK